ncbi:IS66 family insertion sequence element accessory protein TnpB [Mesorhizobium sp. M1004]|uniref:IS66 family insertion sequence element accessory protein TnpB n=1 Tax=Mesorhizobium sp. M1004 TaxID=2957046 RepID=UPI0033371E16
MITVVPTDRIYLCCGETDMRRGINSLARMVQQVLALDPHLCVGRDYVAEPP